MALSSRTVVDVLLSAIMVACIVGFIWICYTQPVFVEKEKEQPQQIIHIINVNVIKDCKEKHD